MADITLPLPNVGSGTLPDGSDSDTNYTGWTKQNALTTAMLARMNDDVIGNEALGAVVGSGTSGNAALSAKVNTLTLNQAINSTFRNKIINPKFDIWQRGVTFTLNAVYTADRWQIVGIGNTHIISQQAVAPQAAIPQRYVMKCSVTSVANAGNTTLLQQHIEGVRTFAGKRVCVTIEAWSSVAGKKIGTSCDQVMGTGGSPSANVLGTGKSITLGTGLTKQSVFLDIPDITGLTVGTNGDDNLDFVIWLDGGASFNTRSGNVGQLSADVYLKRVQIEEVDITNTGQPSAMEDRPISIELTMCRRYFRKNFKMTDAPVNNYAGFLINMGACWGSPNVVVRENFGIPMRAPPTVTFYSSSATGTGAGQWQFYVSGFINAAVTLGAVSEDGFSVNAAPTGAPTNAAVYCLGGYTADSEM